MTTVDISLRVGQKVLVTQSRQVGEESESDGFNQLLNRFRDNVQEENGGSVFVELLDVVKLKCMLQFLMSIINCCALIVVQ